MKTLKCRKGFTLIEVIVVLAILAILAAMAIPSMFGYIESSKESVCEVYREGLLRHFRYYKILHQGDDISIPLSDFIDGKFEDAKADVDSYKRCPNGGTYTAKEGSTAILCSNHSRVIGDNIEENENEDIGGGGVPILPLFPELEIPLVGAGWPTHENMFDADGNYRLKAGEICEYDNSYRSEARCVGKECRIGCRFRWSMCHNIKVPICVVLFVYCSAYFLSRVSIIL